MLHKLKLTESEIRDILSKHGVKTNKSAGLDADGKFGPLTAKAIKKAIIG